jgi:hypothetical protein
MQQEDQSTTRMSRFGFKKPRIFPPFWMAFALLAMVALDRWLPVVELTPWFTSGFSWLLLLPGLAITLIATGVSGAPKPASCRSASPHPGHNRHLSLHAQPHVPGDGGVARRAGFEAGVIGGVDSNSLVYRHRAASIHSNEEIFTAIYGDAAATRKSAALALVGCEHSPWSCLHKSFAWHSCACRIRSQTQSAIISPGTQTMKTFFACSGSLLVMLLSATAMADVESDRPAFVNHKRYFEKLYSTQAARNRSSKAQQVTRFFRISA